MACHGEVVLRQRVCHGSQCHGVFWICRRCDRGQRYCSTACQADARKATLRLRPDVIVLDVILPVVNGIEAARRLHQLGSQAEIVFLTGIEDPEYIAAALDPGAKGFIFKLCLYEDLALGILAALEGRTFCSSKGESD